MSIKTNQSFKTYSQTNIAYSWISIFNQNDSNIDSTCDIAIDESQNLYIVGETRPISLAQGFLAKYDQSGNLLWNVTRNDPSSDRSYYTAVKINETSIYACGKYYNSSTSQYQVLLNEYIGSTSVNEVFWKRTGTTSCAGNDMDIDANKNIYIAGYCYSSDSDGLILKLNSTGHEVWNATYGDASGSDSIYSIVVCGGLLYVSGQTNSWGLTSSRGFIALYSSIDGHFMWNFTWNGPNSEDSIVDLQIDRHCNIYALGSSVEPALSSMISIQKYNSTKNLLWKVDYYGPGDVYTGALLLSPNQDRLYVTGGIDNGLITPQDLFLFKYSSEGNLLGNWTWDYSDNDMGKNLLIDSYGNLFIIGDTLASTSGSDAFIMKANFANSGNSPFSNPLDLFILLLILLIIMAPALTILIFIVYKKRRK
ncbi:MAG: hypothetical protein ACTSVY_04750 [Candidatus Helarchaeota archaeon]